MYCSDNVLNPYRGGLDLTTQEDQGEFNSCPIIYQPGARSRTGPADCQFMYCSDTVLNPYRFGLDLNTQEDLGESYSCPMILQFSARSRIEPSNIDFSKSMGQLLGSLGNLNENLREGFGIVAACSDNWRHTMGTRLTSHEDRLLKLEQSLSGMNTAIQNTHSLSLGVQVDHRRTDTMVRSICTPCTI